MAAVVEWHSKSGEAGGPQIALCNVCGDLGAPFVEAVKEGESRMTALLLLKIHAKLHRIYATRFDGES